MTVKIKCPICDVSILKRNLNRHNLTRYHKAGARVIKPTKKVNKGAGIDRLYAKLLVDRDMYISRIRDSYEELNSLKKRESGENLLREIEKDEKELLKINQKIDEILKNTAKVNMNKAESLLTYHPSFVRAMTIVPENKDEDEEKEGDTLDAYYKNQTKGKGKENKKSKVQAVLFSIDSNNYNNSSKRLRFIRNKLHLEPIKRVHITSNYYRYRITEPIKGIKTITKKVNDDISLIIELH